MSSCLARAIFCPSSRTTFASTTKLGHIRACGRNSLCLDRPRQTVVSWHSQSSMACITTTEGRRDAARDVRMEKVASTGGPGAQIDCEIALVEIAVVGRDAAGLAD